MNNNRNKNASITAIQRLNQDYLKIKKDPVPFISAEPLPSNILEWHYLVRGPEKTPYEGGYYHDHHPDTWNPVWSVSTILTGLLSFMVGKDSTLGSIITSDAKKRQLSAQSLAFNLQDKEFCELFPDVADEVKQKQKAQEELGILPQPLALSDEVPDDDGEPQRARLYEPPDINVDRDLRLAMELSARAQEADEQRRRRQEDEELERVLQLSLDENPFKFSARAHVQEDEMRKQEEEELERILQLSQRDNSGLDPDLRLAMELSARAQEDDEHRRMQQEKEELERILQLSLTEH